MTPLERLAKASWDARERYLLPRQQAQWEKAPEFHRDMEVYRMRAVLRELRAISPDLGPTLEQILK